jgi:hypothetical protein
VTTRTAAIIALLKRGLEFTQTAESEGQHRKG